MTKEEWDTAVQTDPSLLTRYPGINPMFEYEAHMRRIKAKTRINTSINKQFISKTVDFDITINQKSIVIKKLMGAPNQIYAPFDADEYEMFLDQQHTAIAQMNWQHFIENDNNLIIGWRW